MNNKFEENKMPRVLLWGGGSKSRIICQMIRESNIGEVEIIFDENLESISYDLEGCFTNDLNELIRLLPYLSHFVVCIGSEHGYARCRVANYLEQLGLEPLEVIHAHSFIEPTSEIGVGCHVMPAAVVHKFTKIGNYCIINTNSTIDHECLIGDGVHIMGAASITGLVNIGDYATIGSNSTIIPSVHIGEGAFVGAGAVVTKNVKPYSIVAGVPAREIGRVEPKFFEEIFVELKRRGILK